MFISLWIFFPLYSAVEIPELFPLEKPIKTQVPENNSAPSELRFIWPKTLSPKWPTINVYRREHEQCRSSARLPAVLTGCPPTPGQGSGSMFQISLSDAVGVSALSPGWAWDLHCRELLSWMEHSDLGHSLSCKTLGIT